MQKSREGFKEKGSKAKKIKKKKESEGNNEIQNVQTSMKKTNRRGRILVSLKFSSILTIGILTVFVLNFFHILSWMWGLSILLVVLIFTFII